MHKLHPIRASFETRFWQYVQKTDACWLWTGFLDRYQRGHLRRGRANEGQEGAARASWIIHNGPIPEGKHVCHHCDNPTCVRPDHLYVGTPLDNMRDKSRRGRHHMQGHGELVAGERNGNAHLTWDIVRTIRKAIASGQSKPLLAKQYGVTAQQIYHIDHNRSWVETSS